MQTILGTSDYTFVASTKKVTLVAPFNTLDEERILKITNLTTRAIMYDSERRTHMISMAAGVITCTYDSTGMADADDLQIIVDLGGDTNNPIYVDLAGGEGAATTPTEYEIDMTSADTEYSQALPANTKKFSIQSIDSIETRISFATGKVATPTMPYEVLYAGQTYRDDVVYLSSKTIYAACSSAGKKMFVRAWT
jgi:hypothetical protein